MLHTGAECRRWGLSVQPWLVEGTKQLLQDTPAPLRDTSLAYTPRCHYAQVCTLPVLSNRQAHLPALPPQALREVLPPLLARLRPGLVCYNAGVDVHADDALGLMALTDAGRCSRWRAAAAVAAATAAASALPLAPPPPHALYLLMQASWPGTDSCLWHALQQAPQWQLPSAEGTRPTMQP